MVRAAGHSVAAVRRELTVVMSGQRIHLPVDAMSTTKHDIRRAAEPPNDSQLPHVRLSDTDRLEAFSDGVLSITITLLVAEIVRPEYASGHLLDKLTAQWASYIAFLASFCYAGVIWLNHRAVFARVRYCDRSLHFANLFLLLTSALIPLPTAVLSAAIQAGSDFDARVAATLYAAIAGSMCLAWLAVFHVLSVRPYLVDENVDPDFFPKERFRAVLGIVLYAVACLAAWLASPQLAMLIFLALPIFYGLTSEGLTETPLRLKFGRAHRRASATADHDRSRIE
jgi:uncharacterized membrane protein